MDKRDQTRQRIQQQLQEGDFTGWFETLYSGADGDVDSVPWANNKSHPFFTQWVSQNNLQGKGKTALVVGCGLGDDADVLAQKGYDVTAFDISETAIKWAKDRFSNSDITFQTADLFNPPQEWHQAFDFVLEIYTVQALPQSLRDKAMQAVANFVAPNGQLLFICSGRDNHDEIPSGPPWAISQTEMEMLIHSGLTQQTFERVIEFNGTRLTSPGFCATYSRMIQGKRNE